jgi:hypothetical protein
LVCVTLAVGTSKNSVWKIIFSPTYVPYSLYPYPKVL